MAGHRTEVSMSTPDSPRSSERNGREEPNALLPLESAADVGRSNYARVEFDQHISEMLTEHARQRSPEDCSDRSYRNHLLGVASEVAVATWQDGVIDVEIYPDYCGDDGVDVVAPAKWGNGTDTFQVKATRKMRSPEQWVAPDELDKADYFVLCATNAPSRYVEIVGYIQQRILRNVGTGYLENGYLLSAEYLSPVKPTHYSPGDVRDVMYS